MAQPDCNPRKRYAISSYGRIVSYTNDISDGLLLKTSAAKGYHLISINRKLKHTRCLHKLVAIYFLPPALPSQSVVIHLDFNKDNNAAKNLQWVTPEEALEHARKNPKYHEYKHKPKPRKQGGKLSAMQVKRLIKAINDPNRRRTYQQIASRYRISLAHLFRIKSGASWKSLNANKQ